MIYKDYSQYENYLKSEAWKQKRIEKAKQANYTCERCGKILKKGFHIHHKTYKNLFNEPLSDLQFLCEDCHKYIHEKRNEKKEKILNRPKKCCNCKFSQIIFIGKERKKILFCCKYMNVCSHRCEFHEPGKWKNTTKRKKKKKNKPKNKKSILS